jgi:hypothetical protein
MAAFERCAVYHQSRLPGEGCCISVAKTMDTSCAMHFQAQLEPFNCSKMQATLCRLTTSGQMQPAMVKSTPLHVLASPPQLGFLYAVHPHNRDTSHQGVLAHSYPLCLWSGSMVWRRMVAQWVFGMQQLLSSLFYDTIPSTDATFR